MDNKEMKLNAYKNFYNKGIWDVKILDYLKLKGVINKDEYNQILSQPKKAKDLRIAEEMYTYEIWDKQSPINGVPAEEILKDNTLKNASAIILIKSPNADNNNVLYVESVDVLKSNNRLRSGLTPEEVAQYQIEYLEEMRNTPQVIYEEVNAGMEIYTRVLQADQLDKIEKILTDIKTLLSDK